MATYMNSLFRTGVPPATHLTKTGFLQVHVFNIELLQQQIKYVSNYRAYSSVVCVCSVVAQLLCTSCECTSKESFVQTDEHRILFQKAKPDLDLCLLLWSDRVKLSIFKEIIDVVVVNLNVGHKNTVTAVLIHMIAFTRLL